MSFKSTSFFGRNCGFRGRHTGWGVDGLKDGDLFRGNVASDARNVGPSDTFLVADLVVIVHIDKHRHID